MEYRLISIQTGVLALLIFLDMFTGGPVAYEVNLDKEAKSLLLGSLDVTLISEIQIQKGDQKIDLQRSGKQKNWFVKTSFLSPVKNGWVDNKLLGILRNLKKGYARTDDPSKYAELGIGTSRSTKIFLRGEDGKIVREIEIGDYNPKDKTYYIKTRTSKEVREIPEIPQEERKSASEFFTRGQLKLKTDRFWWIEKKVFPEAIKIERASLRWRGKQMVLLKGERDGKKAPTKEEKQAGISKESKEFWQLKKFVLSYMQIGNRKIPMRKAVTILANQGQAMKLIQKIENLKASDVVSSLRMLKTEADPSRQELARYNFQNPELVVEIHIKGKKKKYLLAFAKRGKAIYFFLKGAEANLLSNDQGVFVTVYKWDEEEKVQIKTLEKRYQEIQSWDDTELLLPGFESDSIVTVQLTQRAQTDKKEGKKPENLEKPEKPENLEKKESLSVKLSRNQKVWVLDGRLIPADQEKVKEFFNSLEKLKLGKWKGLITDKDSEKKFGFDKGFSISLFPKKGKPLVIWVGKQEGYSFYVHIPNHGKYPRDVFFAPGRMFRYLKAKEWYDYSLFAYKEPEKIKKLILEFPQKVLMITPRTRKPKGEITAGEKASGIVKSDKTYFIIQEFQRKSYAPYDPLKLAYREYIGKKSAMIKLWNLLKNQKAKKLIKAIWDRIDNKEFQSYNLLKYALRLKIRLQKRAGEDSYDFGKKGKNVYLFAFKNQPYSRILQMDQKAFQNLEKFVVDSRPAPQFIQKKKAILSPPKKAPVKKAPVKKAPVKKAPVKKAPVKKAPVKKAPVKKAPVKKAPVKKAPVKKAPVKKTPVKKAPVKKAPVKKAPVKKAPVK